MELTHINEEGRARMVDVSTKLISDRRARATAKICMNAQTLELVRSGGVKKGDVLAVAQVAGIQAAKHTWEIIPMCHPLMLTHLDISFRYEDDGIRIFAESATTAQTGVEMEALCAAQVAALTIYDMCKAVQRDMHIEDACVLEKEGGKSGHFVNQHLMQQAHASTCHEASCTTTAPASTVQDASLTPAAQLATTAPTSEQVLGRIAALNISEKKGVRKHSVESLRLIAGWGCEGDAHAGAWHRQVSLLPLESLNAMKEQLPELKPGDFAENILLEGVVLNQLPIGTRLCCGEAELVLTQIGKECHTSCEIRKLTGSCVMPKQGIFAVVTRSGELHVGDELRIYPCC